MKYNPQFPTMVLPGLSEQPIPQFLGVTVRQPELAALQDLEGPLDKAMTAGARLDALPPGARVAVAVGSRGIADLPKVVRGVTDRLRARGLAPFIVPAMGSHGGGTAEGQVGMLDHLGVSEKSMGVPVLSSMETVDLGEVEPNVHAHIDRNAFEADGIVIVARVKAHTNFEAEIESGLHKMVSVGLGKAMGARNVHIYGRRGLAELMPRIAAQSLARARFVLAVAVVENSHHQLAVLEGVAPEDFPEADRRLLALSKAHAPSLPFAQADLLVVEYLGKDISGTGMDSKVIGREGFRGDPLASPYLNSIVALRTTEASAGNGTGVGNSDFIPLEMANGLDLMAMAFNALTSAGTIRVRIPPVLPTERDVVQGGLRLCWQPDVSRVRACVIRSTSALDRMLITRPLLEELQARGAVLDVWKSAHDLQFDARGVLETGL
ncbi:MAG: hypothetical protein H0S85_16045 [Desulfovibrionaceae bacterium]|jgi:hypothetical protein|nr:hypothetical protein [Desulfovibrionaceae bacterium]